jgi:hypothetical protein
MRLNVFAVITGIVLCAFAAGSVHAGDVQPIGSISGTKFNDLNANGANDADPGFANVTINLIDASGNVVATQLTDANGEYSFTVLDPGIYAVAEDLSTLPGLPGEVVPTTPTEITDIVVGDNGGSEVVDQDFGNTVLGSIHGFKFLDADGDGILDSTESGLAGIEFFLLDSGGDQIATTISDVDGLFGFEQLMPGTYTVGEVDDSLLTTTPNQRTYTLISGEELVFAAGASNLPDGSLKFETVLGDELLWGNRPDGEIPLPAILTLFGVGLIGMGLAKRLV